MSSAWTLTPAAHRNGQAIQQASLLVRMEELLAKARVRRHDILEGWQMPDLALLARLQHNNAATVLLDVTTDPYVALYFACHESNEFEKADGALVAIDVSVRGKAPRTKHFDLGHVGSLRDVFEDLDDRLGVYTPPDVSPRTMAQRGRFIFGPLRELGYSTLLIQRNDWNALKLRKLFSAARGIGQPPKPAVVAIEIKASLKPQLRNILEQSFGLSAVTLFPDFPGFAAAHRIW